MAAIVLYSASTNQATSAGTAIAATLARSVIPGHTLIACFAGDGAATGVTAAGMGIGGADLALTQLSAATNSGNVACSIWAGTPTTFQLPAYTRAPLNLSLSDGQIWLSGDYLMLAASPGGWYKLNKSDLSIAASNTDYPYSFGCSNSTYVFIYYGGYIYKCDMTGEVLDSYGPATCYSMCCDETHVYAGAYSGSDYRVRKIAISDMSLVLTSSESRTTPLLGFMLRPGDSAYVYFREGRSILAPAKTDLVFASLATEPTYQVQDFGFYPSGDAVRINAAGVITSNVPYWTVQTDASTSPNLAVDDYGVYTRRDGTSSELQGRAKATGAVANFGWYSSPQQDWLDIVSDGTDIFILQGTGVVKISRSALVSPVAITATHASMAARALVVCSATGCGPNVTATATATGSGDRTGSGPTDAVEVPNGFAVGVIGAEEEDDEAGAVTSGAAYIYSVIGQACANLGGAKSITLYAYYKTDAMTDPLYVEQYPTGGHDYASCIAALVAKRAAVERAQRPVNQGLPVRQLRI